MPFWLSSKTFQHDGDRLNHPFHDKNVEARYQAWPDDVRTRLLHLRELVFDVAESTSGVGEIEETLKWNVPAYLTHNPKSGTTIRLAGNTDSGQYGLYVHCQTTLVQDFRVIYPDIFVYEKNRAILFDLADEVAEEELRHCISMALTYHLKN